MASKIKPIIDNAAFVKTVHDFRRLRLCEHCGGPGDRDQMVVGPPLPVQGCGFTAWRDSLYHTVCFLTVYGFKAVLKLSAKEAGKFRMSDLTKPQMRKILNHLAKQT